MIELFERKYGRGIVYNRFNIYCDKHTKWSPALVPHNLIRSETEIKMKKKEEKFYH